MTVLELYQTLEDILRDEDWDGSITVELRLDRDDAPYFYPISFVTQGPRSIKLVADDREPRQPTLSGEGK